jgi:hypothetical protein
MVQRARRVRLPALLLGVVAALVLVVVWGPAPVVAFDFFNQFFGGQQQQQGQGQGQQQQQRGGPAAPPASTLRLPKRPGCLLGVR